MRSFLLGLMFLCTSVGIGAQTLVTLKGVVRTDESEGSRAISGASVRVTSDADGRVRGAYTDAQGAFTIRDIPEGTYTMRVTCVGYSSFERQAFAITSGMPSQNISMMVEIVQKDATVVTASRVTQKSSEAPASITVIDQRAIAERPRQTPVEHIQGEAGVDMASTNIASKQVTVRGFNNVFTGNLMMLTDYRMAGVPSLRANITYFVPTLDQDIERIELVRGPGSALYGPNAALGVMNIITSSPFSSKGTTVFFSGGIRSATDVPNDNGNYFSHVGLRHAGTMGERFGYKVSAQYMNAWDWVYNDPAEIVPRDNIMRRYTADVRFDYLLGDEATLTLSGGLASAVSSVEMTDIGAAQARDWKYFNGNARLTWNELFFQVFINGNDAGETVNLRTNEALIDRSSLIGSRLQHASHVGDDIRLTYGGDLFYTNPVTDGTINGVNEDSDTYVEVGAYLQADVVVVKDVLNLLAAGRIDKHSVLDDPVFSPRAALVYRPFTDQTFRATFNQAFTTPSSVDLFLDILGVQDAFSMALINPQWTTDVWASSGAKNGYTFERRNGLPMFVSQYNRTSRTALDSASSNGVWEGQTSALLAALSLSSALTPEQKAFLNQFLNSIPAPQDIEGHMALLNPTTKEFKIAGSVDDIPKLKPTITTTYEIGYQGFLFDQLRVNIDVYYSQVTDFISGLQIVTPNVFFDEAQTKNYLKPLMKGAMMQGGMSEAEAEASSEQLSTMLAGVYAQIPVGTVSPRESSHQGDILLAARNFGSIDYYGVDMSFQWVPVEWMEFGGALSYMSDNYFTAEEVGGVQDFAFNAPMYKGAFNATYRHLSSGLVVGGQWRWVDGFKMLSGVYEGPVEAYSMVDLTAQVPVPGVDRLTATLSFTNLLDHRVSQFVGAPQIGRLSTLRFQYTF
jgi:outer membrane receptor for ferrienterochelin and colicins